MAHKGKIKVHGPPRHVKAPEHQVPQPDVLGDQIGHRFWFVHSWPVRRRPIMPFLAFVMALVGIAMIAFGEVDWHYCLPAIIVLFVVALVVYLFNRKP